MNKLLRVVLVAGIAVAAGCGGAPVPPEGTLNCDSGRCRDGGADLRVDRAPPPAVDGGPGVDAWIGPDARRIVDAVVAETPLAVDASALPDTVDSALAVDVGGVDASPPDARLALDRASDPAGPPDAPADAPYGAEAQPDVPMGPEAGPDIPLALDVMIDALPADTPPAFDLASGDVADAEPDTTPPDAESDSAPACPGVLCDGFEDGDSTGWAIIGDGTALDWAVVLDDTNHVLAQNTDTSATLRLARAGQVSWTDQTVEVRLKVTSYGAAANANRALVCARTVSANSAYCLAVSADGGGTLTLLKRRASGGGSWETVGTPVTGVGMAADTWHTLRLVVSGSSPVTLTAFLDPTGTPTPTLTASDTTQVIVAGYAAVGTEGAQAAFDDVLVTIP